MDNFEDKKYTVDEIIGEIVRLEDMDTFEFIEEDIKSLPSNIHEGAIILLDTDGYHIEEEQLREEENKRNKIRERLERLKRLKKHEE